MLSIASMSAQRSGDARTACKSVSPTAAVRPANDMTFFTPHFWDFSKKTCWVNWTKLNTIVTVVAFTTRCCFRWSIQYCCRRMSQLRWHDFYVYSDCCKTTKVCRSCLKTIFVLTLWIFRVTLRPFVRDFRFEHSYNSFNFHSSANESAGKIKRKTKSTLKSGTNFVRFMYFVEIHDLSIIQRHHKTARHN